MITSPPSGASPNPKIWARADMINLLRKEHNLTVYGATHLLDSIIAVLSRHLIEGDVLHFKNFGKLESRLFKEQDLVYFGQRKELPVRRVLRFSPSMHIRKMLRDRNQ